MPDSGAAILGDFNAIAEIVSRLLPLIEYVPSSLGKWVPPLKQISKAVEKNAAVLALAAAGQKAMQGRLTLVSSVVSAMNARTLGASRGFSALAAAGAYAGSRIINHFKQAGYAARRLQRETAAAQAQMAKEAARQGGEKKGFFDSPAGKLLELVGGYKLVTAAVQHFRDVFDTGDKLAREAASTGILAGQLVVLNQAAKDNGVDNIAASVNHMQVALVEAARSGIGPAATALGLLGIQASALVNKNPVDQLKEIGTALRGIKSPELRTNIVRDLFGKEGNQLLPMLDSANALGDAQQALGKQAGILGANAAAFSTVATRLSHAGLKLQGFFVGMDAQVLPLMDAATKRLDRLDLADMGTRFGDGIRAAVNALAGGFSDPGAILDGTLLYLRAGMLGAGNVLIAVIQAAAKDFPTILMGLGGVFVGLQQVISGTLMKAFAGPIEYLAAQITYWFERISAESSRIADRLQVGGTAEGNSWRKQVDQWSMQHETLKNKLRAGGELDENDMPITDNARNRLKLMDQMQPRNPFAGRSLTEIQASIQGTVAGSGDEQLAAGKATMASAMNDLFDSVAAAFKDLDVTDALGAGKVLAEANTKLAALSAAGKEIVDKAISTPDAGAKAKDPFAVFRNFATFGANLLQSSGPLHGASMAGTLLGSPSGMFDFAKVANLSTAFGRTPVLSAAERNAFADAYVGAGGQRTGTTAGAFGVVHSGDAQRRKELARNQARADLKAQTETEKQTGLLDKIYRVTDQAWGDSQ